jgi:hypothetical protein
MRRFTRLTNAFSKKVENLAAAVSLHFLHCTFARVHQSLSDPYPQDPGHGRRHRGSRLVAGRDRRAPGLSEDGSCAIETNAPRAGLLCQVHGTRGPEIAFIPSRRLQGYQPSPDRFTWQPLGRNRPREHLTRPVAPEIQTDPLPGAIKHLTHT